MEGMTPLEIASANLAWLFDLLERSESPPVLNDKGLGLALGRVGSQCYACAESIADGIPMVVVRDINLCVFCLRS